MREDKIKYIKCNIYWFQKEDAGYNDKTHNVQSYHEMEEHVKTERKETFGDGVLEWNNGIHKVKEQIWIVEKSIVSLLCCAVIFIGREP